MNNVVETGIPKPYLLCRSNLGEGYLFREVYVCLLFPLPFASALLQQQPSVSSEYTRDYINKVLI